MQLLTEFYEGKHIDLSENDTAMVEEEEMVRVTDAELDAIRLSLSVALRSVLVSLPFAVLVAWLLTRQRLRGRLILDVLVHLPLVLPPVVV